MKRSEAAKLWTMIATAYAEGLRWLNGAPDGEGKTQLDRTAELYELFLVDLDYETASAALKRLIATWAPTSANRYPPISVMRAAVLAQATGRRRSGIEAWGDTRKLSGSYTEDRLDKLDPIVRQCLDTLGWIMWRVVTSAGQDVRRWHLSSESENEASDRSKFCELYDKLAAGVAEDALVGELAPPLPRRQLGAGVAALLPEPKA